MTENQVLNELVRGAYDMHIHNGPDIIQRLMNDIQIAQAAKSAVNGH
jgi:hypothetical protein